MKSGKKKGVEKKEKKRERKERKNERKEKREAQKQWLRSNGLYIEGMAQFPTWEGQSACPDDGDQWLWPLVSIDFY